jgi:hypothetical protein
MTLFAGATQVQKAYIGASAVNAIMHAGVNVLGVNGSFPGITDSELYLPLTNTLVPTRGASTPTFTRATAAWDFDSEGKLNLNIPSGCPRFTGARLVRNRIVNSDPSSASWTLTNCTVAQTTDPAGGSAAAVVTVTASASNSIRPTSQYSFTGDNRASFYFKPGTADWCRLLIYDGSGNQARFWFNALTQQIGTLSTGGTGWTAVSAAISNEGSGWFRLQALASITGNTYFQVNACDADNSTNCTTVSGKTITIAFPQSENVSGQADQTASEYVSVGVLSAPFHGAGADGCKWFSTNKDGSAISAATLKGYIAEPSRVNNCLWGRDATNAAWTKSNVTAGKTATGLDNVANSASRLTAAANDATLLQLLTAATGTRTTSAWIKRVSGSGTVSLTRNGGTSWTDITSSLVAGTWVPVAVTSDVGANPTVGLKMGTSGDVIDVDCFQDENGAWRTSPILTTTAAVTRNSDVLSYASAFDVAQGTALCSVQSNVPINSGAACYALGGDSSNTRFLYSSSADSRSSSSAYDGTTVASAVGNDITTGIRKRATRWGNDLKLCCDGNLGVTQIFDGSMGATPTLYIGLRAGGSPDQLSGNIGEVHIWNTPLTDAQMQQVTT